jgi:hypothetical protein
MTGVYFYASHNAYLIQQWGVRRVPPLKDGRLLISSDKLNKALYMDQNLLIQTEASSAATHAPPQQRPSPLLHVLQAFYYPLNYKRQPPPSQDNSFLSQFDRQIVYLVPPQGPHRVPILMSIRVTTSHQGRYSSSFPNPES